MRANFRLDLPQPRRIACSPDKYVGGCAMGFLNRSNNRTELLLEKKIQFAGVADVEHPHTYELRYNHATHTASLWIDGKLAASDYHGHRQFRENRGILFGAVAYLDAAAGIGVFRSVRFEAQ